MKGLVSILVGPWLIRFASLQNGLASSSRRSIDQSERETKFMETKQIVLGILTAVFVFGAYFLGLFQGQKNALKWREFFQNIRGSLTRGGFGWALALPALWVLLYY